MLLLVTRVVGLEAPLLQEDAVRPHTHLSPKGASHIRHRAPYLDLQDQEEIEATTSAHQDEVDLSQEVDPFHVQDRTHALRALRHVPLEPHLAVLAIGRDLILNQSRVHLVIINRQLAQTSAPNPNRAPCHLRVIN